MDTRDDLFATKDNDDDDAVVAIRLALAAHELRNPLTAIIGFGDLLSATGSDLSGSEIRAAAASIARMTRRLATTVDDLLQAGELATSGGNRSEFDVDELIATCLEGAPPPVGVTVVTDLHGVQPLRPIWTDDARLVRIVSNFLSNAYRYGGPTVTVRVRAGTGAIRIEVEDDGAGAPADLVPEIFELFVRGNHRRGQTEPGGTGLGLAIARMAAESIGGTVRYDDVRPHGARFTVELPTRLDNAQR